MSISSRITAMQEHLQDDYDVLELAGADLTNVDKNIINLKPTWKERLLYFINNGTDIVWENWDKVTGEGTSLTLNNTLEAKMKIVLKGNTSQSGTPTPTSPQDIHVVSGDNSIVVCGKNLFDENYYNNNSLYQNNVYRYVKTNIKGNRTLYVRAQLKEGKTGISGLYLGLCTKVQPNISGAKLIYFVYNGTVWGGPYDKDFSGNEDLYFTFYPTTVSVSDIFDTYNFIISTTSTTYEPYQSASYPINLGDNLLDMNNLLVGIYTPSATPTISGSGDVYKSFNLTLKKGTYSLLSSSSIYAVRDFSSYDYSGQVTLGSFPANTKCTFTITQDATVYFSFRKYDNTAWDSTKDKVWLVEGSGTKPYRQYMTPIELCKIGTYQDKIDKSSGKNLIGLGTQLNGFTDTSNIFHTYSTNSIGYYFETAKLPNQITFSCVGGNRANVSYFNAIPVDNATATSRDISNDNPRTITINKTYSYIHIQFSYNDANVSNIMLNEGTQALPYEPYGTGWYLKKEIGKIVLDGSEAWQQWGGGTVFFISKISSVRIGLSNYYKYNETATGSGQLNNGEFFIHDSANSNYVLFKNTSITTVADFKTWLGTHNTEVLYVLDTPTYETITDTTLLGQLEALEKGKSYTGQTNISQINNDNASIMSASALQNI